jgi:hypothetical protein
VTIRKAIAVDIAGGAGEAKGDKPGRVGGLGDPHAAGHGHEPREQVGDGVHQNQFGHGGVVPERPQAEPEDDGLQQLGSQVARKDHPDLRR